jgi:hypothetical protein
MGPRDERRADDGMLVVQPRGTLQGLQRKQQPSSSRRQNL